MYTYIACHEALRAQDLIIDIQSVRQLCEKLLKYGGSSSYTLHTARAGNHSRRASDADKLRTGLLTG